MDFYSEAALFTSMGWMIFPLRPGSKQPLIPRSEGGRGYQDATDNDDFISGWAERCPNANIGIACGASGLMVVDLDPRNGCWDQLEKWKKQGNVFPRTVHARTRSGGLHLYFSLPQPLPEGWKRKLPGGIDIQVGGKYVVAPPSVILATEVDDGQAGAYTWELPPLSPDLPRPPAWLMNLLKPEPVKPYSGPKADGDAGVRLAGAIEKVRTAGKGQRNNTLNSMAHMVGRLVGEGMINQGEAEERLLAAALEVGLTRPESIATILSGMRSGARHAGNSPQKQLPGMSKIR